MLHARAAGAETPARRGRMIALRRVALGFPVSWSHRRPYSLPAVGTPGKGPYFLDWFPGNGVYGEDFIGAPRDADGVLLYGSRLYHPIRIAQFALHRFNRWHATAESEAKSDFLAQAKWLRDHQDHLGRYRFPFPWSKYGAEAGWISAMAQGEAISVLLRAHALEPANNYGDAALRAVRPFFIHCGSGGVAWRSGPDLFFEEVANQHAPHILNGCIFALWGVWELWRRSEDHRLERIISNCVDTLRKWLPRFDTGWWTCYSLLHSGGDQRHVATLKYHQFHIAQMRVLARMFDQSCFEEAAARWADYIERPTCRIRVLLAALRSIPERALGRDTIAGGAHT